MYISVNNYKEKYLVGKSAAAISDEIVKLRREILKVKNKLESPAGAYDFRSYSNESTAIDIYKEYLFAAVYHLASLTGESPAFTEEEKSSFVFDSVVDDVSCLTLTVGRYLEKKYELDLSGSEASVREMRLESDAVQKSVDIAYAREVIRGLHLGEWKESYTPEQYGCTLNEPVRWQLRLDYANGSAPRFFDGVGVFPYNFSVLCRLLGADII